MYCRKLSANLNCSADLKMLSQFTGRKKWTVLPFVNIKPGVYPGTSSALIENHDEHV